MKKMFKKSMAVIAIVLVIATVFVACGGKNSVVGKWASSVEGVEVISFNFTENGKMSIAVAGVTSPEYDYRIEGNKIIYSLGGIEAETEFSISGNKLTLEYMATSYTLEKVK